MRFHEVNCFDKFMLSICSFISFENPITHYFIYMCKSSNYSGLKEEIVTLSHPRARPPQSSPPLPMSFYCTCGWPRFSALLLHLLPQCLCLIRPPLSPPAHWCHLPTSRQPQPNRLISPPLAVTPYHATSQFAEPRKFQRIQMKSFFLQ